MDREAALETAGAFAHRNTGSALGNRILALAAVFAADAGPRFRQHHTFIPNDRNSEARNAGFFLHPMKE
ncbi:MAG: hypothetical protein M0T84_14675 [Betaproteobacteria bacterium]|nr:hypothetical protein [Betaproteobacteria bacterium]